MGSNKFCVDLRRPISTGIGRVGFNIAKVLLSNSSLNKDLVFLAAPETSQEVITLANNSAKVVQVNFDLFSDADLFDLPRLIKKLKIGVFITPQYWASPFIECQTIKMIHDMLPVLGNQYLPSLDEIQPVLSNASLNGMATFVNWFNKVKGTYTTWSDDKFRSIYYRKSNTLIDHYRLGMYAVTVDTAPIILTCSYYSFNQIVSVFPQAAPKLRIVYPFIETEAISVSKEAYNREFKILNVGKLSPRKNQYLLCRSFIKAYEKLSEHLKKRAELILVGGKGVQFYGSDVIDFVNKVCDKYPIRFLGTISNSKLNDLYCTSGLFVYPSAYEGFGIPIIEAMSAGLPVITSDGGGTVEAARGAAYIINDLDESTLSQSMIDVFTDDSLYENLITKGIKEAATYSFSQTSKQIESALDAMNSQETSR